MGGFSTYQARSAVGDVAKVLGISEFQIRRSHRTPAACAPARPCADASRCGQECRDLPLGEGTLSHRAANGRVPGRLSAPSENAPVRRGPLAPAPGGADAHVSCANKGYPTTHFDMDAVEAIGLVKMDILAQGGLAVMRDVAASLRQRGLEIDLQRFTVHSATAATCLQETSGVGYPASRIADGPAAGQSQISNFKSQISSPPIPGSIRGSGI